MGAEDTADRRRRWLLCVFGGAFISLAYLSGALRFIDDHLADIRFRLVRSQPSGEVVVVAIDPRSLRAFHTWPWPRRFHAQAIEAINGAGAARIAVDIDFSAPSEPADDQALTEAIAHAGGKVILPAFEQPEGSAPHKLLASNPLPSLARDAQIASVNVTPDRFGIVRQMARYTTWASAILPTFPQAASAVDQALTSSFFVDFGIRSDQIKMVPFIDVLSGAVDPTVFSGKVVFIGATALELGDKVSVPVLGVTSGVVLQALATESLLLGRDLRRVSPWITLLAAILIFVGMERAVRNRRIVAQCAITGGFAGVALAVPIAVQATFPLMVDATPGLLSVGVALFVNALYRLRDLDLRLISQTLLLSRTDSLMRRVVEATHDGIVVVDRQGFIRSVNPAAEQIFGETARNLLGHHVDTVIGSRPRDPSSLFDAEGKDDSTEVSVPHPDGSTSIIEITFRSLPGEADGTHVAILHDITEIRERENQTKAARDQAEAANRAKTQFLANMSHELRTPLNAVIGFSEVMEAELHGPLGSDHYRGYAAHIRSSASHLLEIINDILDISAIEAGDRRMAESLIDPVLVCQSALTLLRGRAQASHIQLKAAVASDCGLLLADRRMVMQILVNLLSNAIKFSRPKGLVEVQVSMSEDRGMTFAVIDHGIGIAAENLGRVLKPFEQVEGAYSRRHDGVGLGLPLVKSLAELHGATLSLESEFGKGTVVTVTFPAIRCTMRPDASEDAHDDEAELRGNSLSSVTLQ